MGVTTRPETTVIDGVTYTTKKFDADRAFNLYAEVGAVIPEEVLTLIMLPVSTTLAKQRADKGAENMSTTLGAAMNDVLVMLETPGVLARVVHTVMRQAADVPGGFSGLLKRVLAQTTANPITIAEGMQGGEESVVVHFNSHFGGGLMGMKLAVQVWIWVLRVNLGKPSFGAP